MTIEDLVQLHIDRIARLERFLRAAHLGRRAQQSAASRRVRRRLIAAIDDMLDYEREALKADRAYLAATTPAERAQDERAEPGCWENEDMFAVDFAEIQLLGRAPVLGEGRAFDAERGRWYRVAKGFPVTLPLDAQELGDLAVLIACMEGELGIAFTAVRVFWTENALEIFVCEQEMFRDVQPG